MCVFADFLVCFPFYLFSCVLLSHTTIHCYHFCWFYILSQITYVTVIGASCLSLLFSLDLCFSYHVPFAEKKTGLSEVIIIWSSKTSYIGILLFQEILPRLIGNLSPTIYKGFLHPRWLALGFLPFTIAQTSVIPKSRLSTPGMKSPQSFLWPTVVPYLPYTQFVRVLSTSTGVFIR